MRRRILVDFFVVLLVGTIGGTLFAYAAAKLAERIFPWLASNWGGLATGAFILGIVAVCGYTTRQRP